MCMWRLKDVDMDLYVDVYVQMCMWMLKDVYVDVERCGCGYVCGCGCACMWMLKDLDVDVERCGCGC